MVPKGNILESFNLMIKQMIRGKQYLLLPLVNNIFLLRVSKKMFFCVCVVNCWQLVFYCQNTTDEVLISASHTSDLTRHGCLSASVSLNVFKNQTVVKPLHPLTTVELIT